MTLWPRFPLVYEINTRVWLADLALQCGRRVTLADVPDEEFRKWSDFHFDAIWLMGVWQPSEYSRELALQDQELMAAFSKVLPDWKPEDVASSPYSVADYRVDENLGGDAGLAQFRDKLKDHSIKLVLDFVPNHTAVEHPWVTTNPDFYINIPENGWQKRTFEITQRASYQRQLLAACKRGGNIGVLLGPASGDLCTVDIDTDDEIETFLKLNPKLVSSLRTRGANGCQIWVRIVGPYPARRINSKLKVPGTDNKKSVAEWRGGGGHQSVIAGKHPDDGVFYRFMVEELAIEIAFDEVKWPKRWGMIFKGDGGAKQGRATGETAGTLSPERADRIWQYIKKVAPAVSGKGGSNPTYRLANVLVSGFALSVEQAWPFMTMYSMMKCEPEWSDSEIDHKLEDALEADHGDKPRGHLWGDDSDAGPWSDPRPLHVEMRPVALLRAEMIPEPLRPWMVDTAHRMQCPLDFVAVAAICMVSGVIGAGCTIRPKERDNWAVVPNLWGGVIARSGMKKTPAIEEAFKPLRRLEHLAKEKHDASKNEHAAEHVAFEARRKALKTEMEKAAKEDGNLDEIKAQYAGLKSPEGALRRRFITSDTTIEKASELMKENPRGLTILRDELIGLLVVWDKEDHKDDRCFHLQGWNGYGSYTSDRIGRGTIDTPQLCEVIFGGIQPSRFLVYLRLARNNIENDGLLQRFQLLVLPDELTGKPEIVDEYPDLDAKNRVFTIVEKLSEMDFIACGGQIDEFTKIPYFHFAPAAQVFFNNWLLALETKLRGDDDDPIINEHLSKYPKLMPSLALIFHLIEVADGNVTPQDDLFADQPNEVPLRCAQQAAAWCKYLETHARRIYGLMANVTVQGGKRILGKIKDGTLKEGFNAWDVYHQGWSFLDTKELAQAALDELVDTGWLRENSPSKPSQKGGRPMSPTYQIHPQACEILKKEKVAE